MAKQRYVNTKFWNDNFISELEPLERYLFLYFLTNEHTNIAGIYELPINTISFETGVKLEELKKIIKKLTRKIIYIDGWVYIKNFQKHQSIESEKVKRGIEIEMSKIPLKIKEKIGYQYPIDTSPRPIIYSNSNSNSNTNVKSSLFLDKFTNKNLIKDMYNYYDVDEDGNPILKKNRLKRINKDENTELIKVGLLWRKLCAEFLKVRQDDVVMKNIYYPIRSLYDREKYTIKDYESLFKYFFNDKNIKQEDKMGFDLCMSEKYVAKYKIFKRSQDKPVSNAQIAEKIKL